MTAPISVIIPTLNVVNCLPQILEPLVAGTLSGLVKEVIFADGQSTDGIGVIAEEAGAQLIKSERGRGTQLAIGAQAAQGEWLLFLHADSVLSDDWINKVYEHIQHDKPGYFKLKFDSNSWKSRMVAGWANKRSKIFGLPYGDQGLLISRTLYQSIGGYKHIPLMEDVDLVRRLNPVMIDSIITTSAKRYNQDGWVKRGARNIICLLCFYMGVPSKRIEAIYRSGT